MSYILDALKKAERERDIAQLPTLTTVHDMPTKQSRRRVWVIVGVCLICAALLGWIGFLSVRPAANHGAPTPDIGNAAERADVAPILPLKGEDASERIVPQETAEAKAQTPDPADKNPPTEGIHDSVRSQIQKQPPQSSPAQLDPIPQQAPPMRIFTQETTGVPSTPATTPSKPLSLREAITNMNMTILFYAEARSERMVFINDRKYAEGDYVDGLYLLESITPEGAWLSFQEERAILRAKSR